MLQARQIRRELCHVMGYGQYEANMEPNMESTWSQWVTSHRPKPILNLSYSIVPEIGPLIGLFDYPKSVSEILQDKV